MNVIFSDAVQQALLDTARRAAERIMHFYAEGHSVEHKEDKSPVTDADHAANEIIVSALAKLTPEIPVVAEESAHTHTLDVSGHPRFWLVDPLDGTKSFIKRTGEFTVNMGLIENGVPVWGVIVIPAKDIIYYTGAGGGAYRQAGEKISVRIPPAQGITVVASQSHYSPATDQYLKEYKVAEFIQANSSLKFCKVAEGEADLYPRFGTTMEWDTAAGDAILRAAGGRVEHPDGKAFTYGKPEFRNGNFVAYGGMK